MPLEAVFLFCIYLSKSSLFCPAIVEAMFEITKSCTFLRKWHGTEYGKYKYLFCPSFMTIVLKPSNISFLIHYPRLQLPGIDLHRKSEAKHALR